MASKTWRSVRLEAEVAGMLDEIATDLFNNYNAGKRKDMPGGKPALPSTSAVCRMLAEEWFRHKEAGRRKKDKPAGGQGVEEPAAGQESSKPAGKPSGGKPAKSRRTQRTQKARAKTGQAEGKQS